MNLCFDTLGKNVVLMLKMKILEILSIYPPFSVYRFQEPPLRAQPIIKYAFTEKIAT